MEQLALIRMENLAKVYGFKYKFFWQPVLYYLRPAVPIETELIWVEGRNKGLAMFYKKTYSVISKRSPLPKNFVNLSDLFSNYKEPVYADFCHTVEKGNTMIVDEIFKNIKKDLETER